MCKHIQDDGRHVEELDLRLQTLRTDLVSDGLTDDVDELIVIIRWPGWTTLVDVALINSLIDATVRSTEHTRELRRALVQGARLIRDAADGPVVLETETVVSARQ